jgi:hypothetical protein
MSRHATTRRVIWIGLLASALLLAAVPLAPARVGGRTVGFHGYRIAVPAGWPVYDLARRPLTCVRFDRHAIYLGTPSANQRCPAHAVGRTGAILVMPLRAGAARARAPSGELLRTPGSSASFTSAGVRVIATWSRDRGLVARALRHRLTSNAAATRTHPRPRGPRARPAEAVYGGSGFDACTAPSSSTMTAWGSSPYRAIGVYIGGVNEACSQPSLTTAWVSAEVSAGWHLIPTYVGLQGAGSCGGSCATITPSQATAQGRAAASDAVTQAQALGIGAGNPLYNDMEQYTTGGANSAAVLAYLAGWTDQLHADGYLSGVYSSAASGITDLVRVNGSGYSEPDDVWIAHWDDQATTSDSYVPSSDWSDHQRIRQYQGDHRVTYGGVTLDIDSDYLDGATADTAGAAAGVVPDGTFVQVTGSTEIYRIAGGAPLLVNDWSGFGGPQPVQQITQIQFDELRSFPADGTFLSESATGPTYRVAGGSPIGIGTWDIYGGPQPNIQIDPWDIQNMSSPFAHLRSAPADCTVVQGLPSGAYWQFAGGQRTAAPGTPGAISVDDAGLAAFPVAAQSGGVGGGVPSCAPPQPRKAAPKCVAPRLKHMKLVRARAALKRANCRLGRVRRPRHWNHHRLLRVFGQSVAPRSRHPQGFRINLRLL